MSLPSAEVLETSSLGSAMSEESKDTQSTSLLSLPSSPAAVLRRQFVNPQAVIAVLLIIGEGGYSPESMCATCVRSEISL